MGKTRTAIATLVLLMCIPSSGSAQSGAGEDTPWLPSRAVPAGLWLAPDPFGDDESARLAELQAWSKAFGEWQAWSHEWRGRPQPGWFTGFRTRPDKPAPPPWLPERCETLLEDEGPLASGCEQLRAWREDEGAAKVRQARAVTTQQREKVEKTMWWENVHMDLFWPAVQWQNSIYGVAGMHMSTRVAGRLQVFTAPGAMLLNLPARNGTRVWKVAANYGIGYRLLDFRLPGNRPAELHLNLAKAWVLSDTADMVTGRSVDFAGFSITLKKTR
jgi:hypothetical protein